MWAKLELETTNLSPPHSIQSLAEVGKAEGGKQSPRGIQSRRICTYGDVLVTRTRNKGLFENYSKNIIKEVVFYIVLTWDQTARCLQRQRPVECGLESKISL